jgi:phospho-N-acetylmuramoyl-pentapeptide-transferase
MLYNLLQNMSGWLEEIGAHSVLQVLYQLEFRAFSAVLLSFFVVLACGKPVIRWLVRQKIGDSPEFNQDEINRLMASKKNTPTMGGVLICGAVLLSMLLLADLGNGYVHIAALTIVWLAVLGAADDWLKLTAGRRGPAGRDGLYVWEKLLFQIGIGVVAGIALYRMTGDSDGARAVVLPFQRTYDPQAQRLVIESGVYLLGVGSFLAVTVFLVTFFSNAVNLTDGMDGLASGLSVITALAIMVLIYIAADPARAHFMLYPFVDGAGELMVVAGALAGACLGFLWFNCLPAKVFMGDTGSLPIGGVLAVMAVAIRQEFLLLLIGGVFVVEAASVVLQIACFKATGGGPNGMRLFRCAPIHHHFHLKGWSEQQIVTRAWVITVVLTMIALASLKMR